MIEKILNIYNKYDSGHISDKDALQEISDILKKDQPDMTSDINEVYKLYNTGSIDSGDALMRVMNLIEKISDFPEDAVVFPKVITKIIFE